MDFWVFMEEALVTQDYDSRGHHLPYIPPIIKWF
jgi:hypothetical protein